jgi:hypothetical protein
MHDASEPAVVPHFLHGRDAAIGGLPLTLIGDLEEVVWSSNEGAIGDEPGDRRAFKEALKDRLGKRISHTGEALLLS